MKTLTGTGFTILFVADKTDFAVTEGGEICLGLFTKLFEASGEA